MEAAPPKSGIIFRSTHKANGEILLTPNCVSATLNAVTISNGKWQVQTIEHLLAALYATGLTDVYIEINTDEIPIMDGSAYPFYAAIIEAGRQESTVELSSLCLNTAVWVVDGDRYVIALPQDHLSISYAIDYNHPLIGKQSLSMDFINGESLAREILPARTFALLNDVEALQAKGLIKGGSIDNAVVLTDTGYANDTLRFENECIRHKILDLIGDLYLLGRPLHAHLIAAKAGHSLDIALVTKIFANQQGNELNLHR